MRAIACVVARLPFRKRLLLTMHKTCIACQSEKTYAIVRRNVPERAGGWGFALPARLSEWQGRQPSLSWRGPALSVEILPTPGSRSHAAIPAERNTVAYGTCVHVLVDHVGLG